MGKKYYREVAETAADPVAVAGDPVVVVREVAGPSRYGKFPPEKGKNTGKS